MLGSRCGISVVANLEMMRKTVREIGYNLVWKRNVCQKEAYFSVCFLATLRIVLKRYRCERINYSKCSYTHLF